MSLSPSYPIRRAFDLNKERLVFGVTDGVTTLEEVTPWEGGLMSPATNSFLLTNFKALEFFLGLFWV